ncbi:MAG: Fe-Mn family superoxide dismutase [Phycisphaerales bacterium]|nr:hypothetical protein [Planctomycetota bacterium]
MAEISLTRRELVAAAISGVGCAVTTQSAGISFPLNSASNKSEIGVIGSLDSLQPPRIEYEFTEFMPLFSARAVERHLCFHHARYFREMNRESERLRGLGSQVPVKSIPDARILHWYQAEHLNHCRLWSSLIPADKSSAQRRRIPLADLVMDRYGGFSRFAAALGEATQKCPHGGWLWCCIDGNGSLCCYWTRPGSSMTVFPAPDFVIDLHEHSFIADHGNDRVRYGTAAAALLNWEAMSHGSRLKEQFQRASF